MAASCSKNERKKWKKKKNCLETKMANFNRKHLDYTKIQNHKSVFLQLKLKITNP